MKQDDKLGCELLQDYKKSQPEAYERQRRKYEHWGVTRKEYDEHIIDEMLHEYWEAEATGWEENLDLPTEEELIAGDSSLLKIVRSALRELKETTPTHKELVAWYGNLHKSDLSDDSKMFKEVCFEKLTYPEIKTRQRRIWRLERLIPRKKSTREDKYQEQLVRARQVPIVGEAEKYLNIVKCGSKYKGLCPFHLEKRASLIFYPESNSFYCFGCNFGGDIITFKKTIDNLSHAEAVRDLSQL